MAERSEKHTERKNNFKYTHMHNEQGKAGEEIEKF